MSRVTRGVFRDATKESVYSLLYLYRPVIRYTPFFCWMYGAKAGICFSVKNWRGRDFLLC